MNKSLSKEMERKLNMAVKTSYANRGMELEDLIIFTNEIYRKKGLALVDKVATPWAVNYNHKTRKVFSAYPLEKSTVDFIGVSHGRAIAFEAKSTNIKTNFPLKNIREHQIQYLKTHRNQGGISFFIIEFTKQQEYYFVPIEKIYPWWKNSLTGGRKSIPYEWFPTHCDLITSGHGVPLDYLKSCGTVY